MKNKNTSLVVGVVCGVVMIQSASAVITTPVGMGEDSSFLVFETPQLGILGFEVFYDFDPKAPIGTTDLLGILADSQSLFSFTATDFGTIEQANEFLTSVTFDGVTETQPADFSAFFGFFGAGGQTGTTQDETGAFVPAPQPIAFDSFTFTSGLSAPFRIVEPGSTDAIVLGPGGTVPSFTPIPEPSAALLLLVGCGFLGRRTRR